MTLNAVNLSKINFKENNQVASDKVTTPIKSDYKKTPVADSFDKQETVSADSINTSKKGMSKGLKWLLTIGGIGALITVLCLKFRTKKISFEEVQKSLSEIFGKDFSKEETETLIKKYTEIYKEKGTDNYYHKLVDQLKKDYGIEKVNTKLKIDNTIQSGTFQTGGEASINGTITIYTEAMKKVGDEAGFDTLFHELKHVRQYSELWMADFERFLKELTEQALDIQSKETQELIQELLKTGASRKNAEKYLYNEMYKEMKKQLEPIYENLSKFKKDTPEYKKGLEYIESMLRRDNYIATNEKEFEAYKNLLCEKEAFNCGDNAKKLLKYIQQNLK